MSSERRRHLPPSDSSSSESSDPASHYHRLPPSTRITFPPVARTTTSGSSSDSVLSGNNATQGDDDDHQGLLHTKHRSSWRKTFHRTPGQHAVDGLPEDRSDDFFTSPSRRLKHTENCGVSRNENGVLRGWKTILFGSWLNVLVLVMPATLVLKLAGGYTHLVCIFTILAMIPLVRLHDLATSELAMRVGGTRTGLLNASMSNIVELVVAVIALRKCEIRVVQSSLIGAILSKLLLVVGICFFAGGMRFSEQAISIDHTAIQINSTLLSVSATALLIPAVFHFAYKSARHAPSVEARSDAAPLLPTDIDDQSAAILSMSRGVSIVLFAVYVAYLVFQLYSHQHLYEETHNSPSRHLRGERKGWRMTGPDAKRSLARSLSPKANKPSPMELTPPQPEVAAPTPSPMWDRAEKGHWTPDDASTRRDDDISIDVSNGHPTIRVVSTHSSHTPSVRRVRYYEQDPPEAHHYNRHHVRASALLNEIPDVRTPQLSWFMTLVLLSMVTVLVGINVEWLVSSLDSLSTVVSKEWIGLILIPSVSTLAECITAINVSIEDQLALSMSVAIGSTIQTTLFIIPFIVTLGWAIDKPMGLLFDPFESAVLYLSVSTMNYMISDGKSNWLEGVILILLYVIIGVSFWFYPGSNFSSTLATCT